MKRNSKRFFGNSLSLWGGQNKDLGAAFQTLLTGLKLRLDFKPLQRNLQVYTVEPPRATTFGRRTPSQIAENVLSQNLILEPLVKDNNNGNFICVFGCTIVNLATYRQFTNAA